MQSAEVPSGGDFGGNLLGISVPSSSQMIESEQKSCTLSVTSQEKGNSISNLSTQNSEEPHPIMADLSEAVR
jgi:hypothetical protein